MFENVNIEYCTTQVVILQMMWSCGFFASCLLHESLIKTDTCNLSCIPLKIICEIEKFQQLDRNSTRDSIANEKDGQLLSTQAHKSARTYYMWVTAAASKNRGRDAAVVLNLSFFRSPPSKTRKKSKRKREFSLFHQKLSSVLDFKLTHSSLGKIFILILEL